MRPSSAAGPIGAGSGPPAERLAGLRDDWRRQGGTISTLVSLVKLDLQRRFDRGERPAVIGYLDVLPDLLDHSSRVLSLIYEEYCLLEEVGQAPDPDSFCNRYAPWRDSLASQLNYHRAISRAAGGMPSKPPRFPEPGDRFLSFRLRSILGQGGAARVFLADDEDLGGRRSALKVSSDRGEEPSIMGRLQHPHIMPVHSVVRDPETGLRGLCMPYRPGRPLDQVLRRMEDIPAARRTAKTLLDAAAPEDRSVPIDGRGWDGYPRRRSYADACAWVIANLADALDHAHGQGILHRDVKPANILLSAGVGPQLLDFNLAHDPNAPERAESALRGGTLPYMAPEQLEAFRDPARWDDVGPTADIYALGLVLRELLTCRRTEAPPAHLPLPRTINELIDVRLDGWPLIRIDNPKVPHGLDAIVRRCLAFDPEDRYPSASAFAEDLRAFLRRRPPIHAANPNRRERAVNWLHRHRIALAIAAMVAVLLLGAYSLRMGPDALIARASFSYQQSQAATLTPHGQSKFRADAKRDFLRALQRDPSSFRAHHGLALIAHDEGDEDAHDAWIDRAIRTYEARAAEHRPDGHGDEVQGVIDLRSYVARLHVQKVLGPLSEARPRPGDPQGQAPGTGPGIEKLRKVLPNLRVALDFSEGCPPQVQREVLSTAISTYEILAYRSRNPAERLEYRAEAEQLKDRARQLDDGQEPGKLSDKHRAVKHLLERITPEQPESARGE